MLQMSMDIAAPSIFPKSREGKLLVAVTIKGGLKLLVTENS